MSGYFVHGGTQYPYSQQSGQTNANVSDLSYQSHQSQSPFYQTTSYPVQSLRTTISPATKPTTNSSFFTSYNNQPAVNQGYSSVPQTQTYTANDTTSTSTNTGYNRQTTNSSYDALSYNNGSFGTSAFSSTKTNDKFGNSQFGNYKAGSVGSIGNAWLTSQPSQASYNTTYPQNTSYSKPMTESASSSQYSYEKALLVAANQYFMNKKAAETNSRGGKITRGRGRGGVGTSYSNTNPGPKPIKATEVKAYLYAWCGQRRLKPEYTIESLGTPPRLKFACTLTVVGLDYTAKVEAASKKDAQSKAAWDFCDNLVRTGYMKQMELPPKPVDPSPKSVPPKPSTPAGGKQDSGDGTEEGGGWTIENCRQRLNQFTQRERIPAEFKHETLGPEHARTFLAELTVNVKWLKKEFVARERGTNKKQATSVCALSMVRQLYKEGLIEKHGDAIKIPNRRQSMDSNEKRKIDGSNIGMKRKAEEVMETEEVDEYGNWTLEGSRQRLHMYCQATNQPFDIKYNDDGFTPPKNFTATVEIDVSVDGKKQHLEQSATCQGKKPAAQKCALEMVKQLYNLALVEPNIGIQQNKKKNPQRNDYPSLMSTPQFGFNMGPHRKTPHDDITIMEKHRRIYPTEAELSLIQRSVCDVEAALKKVSDDLIVDSMAEEEPSNDDVQTKPEIAIKQEVKTNPEVKTKVEEKTEESKTSKKESKRILQGVMRVESLAKGLLLKGDVSAHLVLLCTEIPSASLIIRISALLTKNLEDTEKKYLVDLQIADCAMHISSPVEAGEGLDTMHASIKVSLTSPTMRSSTVDLSKGPADMLNREKCIASLAELRHAKWFQACANGIPSCVVLLRVLRDLKRRNKTWAPLSDWALELIVEKSLKTAYCQMSVGEALRRVLSCLSSGILLLDGPGLYDPCEKEPTDVIENMTSQQRNDITESAQHALRMLVYRQTYKILGIEPMPVSSSRMPRRYGPSTSFSADGGDPVPLMDISI